MRQPYDAENIRSTHCIIGNDVSLPLQSDKIQCDRHSQHLDYIYPTTVQCASNVHFVFAFIVMEMCSVFGADVAVPGSLANLFTAHIVSGVFAFTKSVTFPAFFSFFRISLLYAFVSFVNHHRVRSLIAIPSFRFTRASTSNAIQLR